MDTKNKFSDSRLGSEAVSSQSRKTRIISAGAVFLAVCAFGAAGVAPLAPDASDLPVKSISEELVLPPLSDQIAMLEQRDQRFVHEEKIRPGDTLAALLNRLGVDDNAAAAFIKSDPTARSVLQLRPGKRVQAQTTSDGQLEWLHAMVVEGKDNTVKNLTVDRNGKAFASKAVEARLEKRIEMRSGEIRSSLFAATDLAQIPDAVAAQIVDMFATNIDFASDLQRGDRFNVVYETFWQDGELIRSGRVLAGEFTNDGTKYQSVWFDEPGSKTGGGYYGFDGKSLKKAFLKSPLEFSRISSGFSMRVHPISGQWKQHKGVDFAASSGTPIRASGDGTVEFAGQQGGYGNLIVLKHWSNYSTVYGHMSRFASGIRRGSPVEQGEIIGYVGATGWATGPHLHYEFRINNEPHDPMGISIPNAEPLAGADLQRLRATTQDMAHRFELLYPNSQRIALAKK
ncbi:MAG: M23 family metallopeptidase [Pseudomonadota bacterium]